jgi:hypothetical protein
MSDATMERRLRWAAVAVMLGLVIEIVSLRWHRPISFVVFVGVGGLSMAAGMLLFLITIVKTGDEK